MLCGVRLAEADLACTFSPVAQTTLTFGSDGAAFGGDTADHDYYVIVTSVNPDIVQVRYCSCVVVSRARCGSNCVIIFVVVVVAVVVAAAVVGLLR